jgi:hypothetical protein
MELKPFMRSDSFSMSRNRESLLEFALDSSSFDDDEELLIGASQIMYTHFQTINTMKHGGSVPGHRVVRHKRELCHWKLFEDYFLDDPESSSRPCVGFG